MKKRSGPVVVLLAILAVGAPAACRTSSSQWSAELRNSDSQLSDRQRQLLRSRIRKLREEIPKLQHEARTLALLLDKPDEANSEQTQGAGRELASILEEMIKADPAAESLAFASGDFLSPVVVTRGKEVPETRLDFEKKEPHLREQVGFFTEGPTTPVDVTGYPDSQFSVALYGSKKMRLRVPVLVGGYYLGDLTAVYDIK